VSAPEFVKQCIQKVVISNIDGKSTTCLVLWYFPALSRKRLASTTDSTTTSFKVNSHSHEKHLLASSCLSVRLSTCISPAPTGRMSVEFDTEDFYEALSKKFSFGYSRTKMSVNLHDDGHFIVAGDINSTYTHCCATLSICMLLAVT
jgi:hypothetical protein